MIKLRTMNLEPLQKNKDSHYLLTKQLAREASVKKYISKRFFEWIEEPSQEDTLELGKTYIINKENTPIGAFGTSNFTANHIVPIWCALSKDYRHQNLGQKFLGEITLYLIENVEKLEDIRLVIHEENIYSIKTAKDNGYIEEAKQDSLISYRYFGSKK